MKKLFTILALLLTVTALTAQRRINPAKQIYVAPDSAYILYSDSLGELQFRRLIDVLPPGTGGGGTLTDNGDGTYTYAISGDTTIINAQADNIFTTANITIGGNTFTAGSNIQQIIQAFVGGDTITQTGHGFFAGTMVGQEPGNGDYFPASASEPDSFPVAFISQVIDANTFVIQNEGWLTWAHGRPEGNDYFLQDNGTFGTTPDSTYAIFGFRTFGTDKAYFDVPELVVSFGPGGSPVINNPVISVTTPGDTTLRVEYYNGDVDNYPINAGSGDADWYVSGTANTIPSNITQDIYHTGKVGIGLQVPTANVHIESPGGSVLRWTMGGQPAITFNTVTSAAPNPPRFWLYTQSGNLAIQLQANVTYFDSITTFRIGATVPPITTPATRGPGVFFSVNGDSYFKGKIYDSLGLQGTVSDVIGSDLDGFVFWKKNAIYQDASGDLVIHPDIPSYANDAAADADGGLPSGGVYRVTGDRNLKIKP